MATEKTPLTGPSPNVGSVPEVSYYVQDTYRFYSRRRKERQLQCIMFVTIVAAFIMALVVTVSYSVSHPDFVPPVTDPPVSILQAPTEPGEISSPRDALPSAPVPAAVAAGDGRALPAPLLQLTRPGTPSSAAPGSAGLSAQEIGEALAAGNAAIAARRRADSAARPLPSPSPDARHRYALSTSSRADGLALAGVAEIAATKRIEGARSFLGGPTSFGSFIDGGWTAEDLCKQRRAIECPVYAAKYRRFDGSCNHPRHLGMAFTPYRRTLPPDYADGVNAPRAGKFGNSLPSAREVSLKVHPPSPSTNPSFTVMLAVFGQFLDHDITATALSQGTNGSSLSCCPPAGAHPECFPVKVGPGDPVYDVAGSSCMEFVRSAPAAQCEIGPRQQLNQVTAFIDGSVIYGSDVDTADGLREFSAGRLRMQSTPDNRLLLPASKKPNDGCNRQLELARGRYCFATGDARANENLHLTTMHLLWARQHNLLADGLAVTNPQWDDEKLYQETRRIVGAQLQHIVYSEFVPIVLGEGEVSRRRMKPLASGFRRRNDSVDVNPAIANHFSAAAFRFAHTLLPGLMKVTDAEKGTSSYVQLHKMLFNPYSLYSEGGVESSITTTTSNAIQKMSTHVTSQLTEHLFEDPMGNQTLPCGLDLVSLNIQRGRDHGLPGYVKWREYCGLQKPLNFEDLKGDMDPEALGAISRLYDNVDDVDLYTGALAELSNGDGLVGPTFTCLIADQFERLQLGDKYWYELAGQPGSFNEEQLKEIKKTTLAGLICDTSDGIYQIQAEVMRSVGPNNPIISCEDIPKSSLSAWKTEMPLLTHSGVEISLQDWLNFKSEVNKTISDIISNIKAKKPPTGSLPNDWLDFQKNINITFTDLKKKFSLLHPKIITNVSLTDNSYSSVRETFDWPSIKAEVDNTVSDVMDSINSNKPPPGSSPAEWLAFRKKINDSILDIQKKFKIIHDKTVSENQASFNIYKNGETPVIDWFQIKKDINITVLDIVNSINVTKPLPGATEADWLAFKKKINDSFISIKNSFKDVHPKHGIPIEMLKASKNQAMVESKVYDWSDIKEDADNTVTDIMDTIKSNKPSPGSLPADWIAFRKKINDSILSTRKKFKIINPKTVIVKSAPLNLYQTGEIPIIYWSQIKNDINTTIIDIINSINATKPLPVNTADDWLAFKKRINDSLVSIKNKFSDLYPKSEISVEMFKASENQVILENESYDWFSVKDEVNKTVAEIMNAININKPPPGSSPVDWLVFREKVNDTLSDVQKKIKIIHPKSLTSKNTSFELNQIGKSPIIDWDQIQYDINTTLIDVVKSINATKPSPGSLPIDWYTYKKKIMDSFAGIKSEFQDIRLQTIIPSESLNTVTKQTTFDWVEFRNQLNKSFSEIITSTMSKRPPIGSTSNDWLAFQNSLNNSFQQIMYQFSDLHPKPTNENINVTDIAAFIKANKPLPGSSQEDWLSFRQKISDSFANMQSKNTYTYSKKSSKKTNVKMSNPENDVNLDTAVFRKKLNKSLTDFISFVKTNKPAADGLMLDWLTFKKEIKSIVTNIKNQVSEFKMKEFLKPDYLEFDTENAEIFNWFDWKIQINQTIDNLLNEIKILGPNDSNWTSFQKDLSKDFTDLKSDVSSMRTTVLPPKLLAIINDDWSNFKNQINNTIEDTLNDINSNTPAPGDPIWANYGLYVKNKFAQLREDLNIIKAAWLEKVKVAIEMMTIINVQSPVVSSSSSLRVNFHYTDYYLRHAFLLLTIRFLIS